MEQKKQMYKKYQLQLVRKPNTSKRHSRESGNPEILIIQARRVCCRLLILCAGFVVFTAGAGLFAADSFVAEFGITEGSTVDKGFVFLDGRYIEAPYIISRKGLELFVNNKKINRPSRYPGYKPYTGDIALTELTNQERQRLYRALEATRNIYESYLQKGYCYMFFNQGGHIKLETYGAAYKLPRIVELLNSSKPSEDKRKGLSALPAYKFVNIDPLVDNFSMSNQLAARLEEAAQELLRVEEFSEVSGEPVDKGFVFLDGKYLDAPYTIARKGLGIFINDKMVVRPEEWPREICSGDKDPILPAEINEESSIYDEIVTRYLLQKSAYLVKHYNCERECQIMEQTLRGLPFVTEATLDEKDRDILHITTTEGHVVPMLLFSYRGMQVGYDRNSVLQRAELRRQHFETMLTRGSCYFLSSKSGERIRLSANSVANKLPQMVQILRSGKPMEKKSEEIQQLRINVDQFIENIIINFSASPQLEARLNKLKTSKKTK